MACEIPQIVDSIVLDNNGMLESFWGFLDRPATPKQRLDEPAITTTTTSSSPSSSVKQQRSQEDEKEEQQQKNNDDNKKEADVEEKITNKVADQQNHQRPEDQAEEGEQQEIDEDDEEEVEEEFGLDSLQAQYFCKTISVFLTKRTTEVKKNAFFKGKRKGKGESRKKFNTTDSAILFIQFIFYYRYSISSNPNLNIWNKF